MTYPVISTTSKDQLVISKSAGGVVGQMAGVQQWLYFPAGASVAPVGMAATELAQRRAFGTVCTGVGQDASVTELVSARQFLIHLFFAFGTYNKDDTTIMNVATSQPKIKNRLRDGYMGFEHLWSMVSFRLS